MIHPVAFLILASLSVASALGVILSRHPVYAVLSLVSTLFALSAIFLLLNAVFVAMVQILIYAGAILVLFLFVVMLLDLAPEQVFKVKGNILRLGGMAAGLFFLWQVVWAINGFRSVAEQAAGQAGTAAVIGELLFTRFALPFEAASLLLLVGIIGAVVLAKKKI